MAAAVRTRIARHALPPQLLRAVRREALVAHRYATESGSGSGPAGTFWLPTDRMESSSSSAVEQALSHLLGLALDNASADAGTAARFVGGEWWVQHRHPQASQDFHFDFDQACFLAGRGLRYPAWSSILYLSDDGGPTVIVDQRCRPDPARTWSDGNRTWWRQLLWRCGHGWRRARSSAPAGTEPVDAAPYRAWN